MIWRSKKAWLLSVLMHYLSPKIIIYVYSGYIKKCWGISRWINPGSNLDTCLPSSALTRFVGGRKGIRPVKVLAWLLVWSEVLTCIRPSWCHCHSVSLASVKSRLVLPFWYYQLTRVILDKGPLNVCVCVYWLTRVVPEKGLLNRCVSLQSCYLLE